MKPNEPKCICYIQIEVACVQEIDEFKNKRNHVKRKTKQAHI